MEDISEEEMAAQVKITEEVMKEILDEEKSWRETIQVGDLIDSAEDGYAVDGRECQYCTKKKLYAIERIHHWSGSAAAVTAYCRTDQPIPGQTGPGTFGMHSSHIIVRDGQVIWESADHMFTRYLLENRATLEQAGTEADWAEEEASLLQPEGVTFPPARNPYE